MRAILGKLSGRFALILPIVSFHGANGLGWLLWAV